MYLSKLSLEKEQTAQEKNAVAAELQKLQEQQEASCKLPAFLKGQHSIWQITQFHKLDDELQHDLVL